MVIGARQPMPVVQVVVDAYRRLPFTLIPWVQEEVAHQQRIARRRQASGELRRRIDRLQRAHDKRIGCGELAVGARQVQHVDFAHALLSTDRHVVAEPAVERPWIERRARSGRVVRIAHLFEVHEEERLVADDRTALARAELVAAHVALRLSVARVEPVVRVQALVAKVFIGAPRESIRPRAGDEVDGDAAVTAHFGAASRRCHCHGLDGILARTNRREKAVAVLVERVVVADSIERQVQERLRQSVDRRSAHAAGCVHAD